MPPNDLALLADECVAGSTVTALRRARFDVEWIAEVAPGEADPAVLSRAFAAGRVLLTEDKDFGELTVRLGHQSPSERFARHFIGLPSTAGEEPSAARCRGIGQARRRSRRRS